MQADFKTIEKLLKIYIKNVINNKVKKFSVFPFYLWTLNWLGDKFFSIFSPDFISAQKVQRFLIPLWIYLQNIFFICHISVCLQQADALPTELCRKLTELRCTQPSCTAPYLATRHPAELTAPYLATPQPNEIWRSYWAKVHPTEHRYSELTVQYCTPSVSIIPAATALAINSLLVSMTPASGLTLFKIYIDCIACVVKGRW